MILVENIAAKEGESATPSQDSESLWSALLYGNKYFEDSPGLQGTEYTFAQGRIHRFYPQHRQNLPGNYRNIRRTVQQGSYCNRTGICRRRNSDGKDWTRRGYQGTVSIHYQVPRPPSLTMPWNSLPRQSYGYGRFSNGGVVLQSRWVGLRTSCVHGPSGARIQRPNL